MQLLLSGIINCTQLVGVATSLWTMDRFGRRPLLLTGAALMFICHLIIAVLVGKFGGRWLDFAVEGWVAVAFLFFYMFSFGATWGPVPWAMPSEIFPSSLRAKGVALSTCSNWFNNFVIVSSQSTPGPITRNLPVPGSHNPTSRPKHRFRGIYFLRCLLWTRLPFHILCCPGNIWQDTGRDGSGFQGRQQ
jgi:MFS family permease